MFRRSNVACATGVWLSLALLAAGCGKPAPPPEGASQEGAHVPTIETGTESNSAPESAAPDGAAPVNPSTAEGGSSASESGVPKQ